MPAWRAARAAAKGRTQERQRLGELEYDDEALFLLRDDPLPSRRANSLC